MQKSESEAISNCSEKEVYKAEIKNKKRHDISKILSAFGICKDLDICSVTKCPK